jgi:hypothetical protein
MFVASEGHPGARLQRALAAGNLIAAEQAAFEISFIPLAEARLLVELYAEKGDPKSERAALKYLARYMDEEKPSLTDFAQVAALPAERSLLMRGLLNRLLVTRSTLSAGTPKPGVAGSSPAAPCLADTPKPPDPQGFPRADTFMRLSRSAPWGCHRCVAARAT